MTLFQANVTLIYFQHKYYKATLTDHFVNSLKYKIYLDYVYTYAIYIRPHYPSGWKKISRQKQNNLEPPERTFFVLFHLQEDNSKVFTDNTKNCNGLIFWTKYICNGLCIGDLPEIRAAATFFQASMKSTYISVWCEQDF